MKKGTTLLACMLLITTLMMARPNKQDIYSETRNPGIDCKFNYPPGHFEQPALSPHPEGLETSFNERMMHENQTHPPDMEIPRMHPARDTRKGMHYTRPNTFKSSLNATLKLDSIIYTDTEDLITYKEIYEYDANGNITLYTSFDWDTNTAEGILVRKREYEYDANGNITFWAVYDWDTNTAEWTPDWKNEYEYDADGNETLFARYDWDTNTMEWIPTGKDEYEYDANGNRTLDAIYYWDTNTAEWIPIGKYEYEYDANGNRTLYAYFEGDTNTTEWIPTGKEEYEYDANGNITLEAYFVGDTNTAEWIPTGKEEYEYDANGKLTLVNRYDWDTNTTEWIPDWKNEYEYDANGKLTLVNRYDWDTNTAEWILVRKWEYEYDANGNRTLYARYDWDVNTAEWIPDWKYEYEYDANGNITLGNRYDWDTNTAEWIPNGKLEYEYGINENLILISKSIIHPSPSIDELFEYRRIEYDENGNLLLNLFISIFSFDSSSETFSNATKTGYSFDLNFHNSDLITPFTADTNKRTHVFNYQWNVDLQDFEPSITETLHYSEVGTTNIDDPSIKPAKVFPNPVSDYLTISIKGNETGTFELFDIQGRLLLSSEVTNNQQINLDDLTHGVYIYHLQVNGEQKTGRLLKK